MTIQQIVIDFLIFTYIIFTFFPILEIIFHNYEYKKRIKENDSEIWEYYVQHKNLYHMNKFKTWLNFFEMIVICFVPIINMCLFTTFIYYNDTLLNNIYERQRDYLKSETKRVKESLNE